MRRTSVGLLATLALLAAAIGWLGQVALTEAGSATIVPPRTVIAVLVLLAVILVAVGWPIRQAVHGNRGRRADPFVATRVLMFAKAASPTGALLTGATIGLLAFVLTRGVPPLSGTLVADIGALVAAIILTAAGLVVESWCRVPPDDTDRAAPNAGTVPR